MADIYAARRQELARTAATSELERLMRRRYWVQVFWIVISAAELIYCLVGAAVVTHGLFLTWRGAALLALSAVYVGRLAWGLWRSRRWQACHASPPNLAITIRVWLITLGLTLGLFALHPMMGWMAYPLFGMAFTLFELPWALIPGLFSYLLIPTTIFVNGYATLGELIQPGALAGWVAAFGVYAAMIYWPTKMMRDRIRREASVAELEEMHAALQEAHRQLELSGERERELAVLRERGRLAREMHDTLGHALVLIAVKLEAARRLRGVDAGRADHELEATQQIVRDAMTELRASLGALRSPVLERESPGRMLATFAHDAGQRAGWHVVYDIASDLGEIEPAARETLLRVGAEALTNAERHAHARSVAVTLKREADGSIRLRVADDGVGPGGVAAAAGRPHYGITGMRERVGALSGWFSIESGTPGGTVVEALVPTPHPACAGPSPSGEPMIGVAPEPDAVNRSASILSHAGAA